MKAILDAARAVAAKWQAIRENNQDAPWDDFSFYKGNARWANGTAADLERLFERSFATTKEACDAAEELVRNRSWDGDYDEPTAARDELLAAIAALR
jgi:hypothetical protein